MNQLKEKWVKVPQDTKKASSICPVCKEAFVKEWSEDEEEWIWKNALNINGTVSFFSFSFLNSKSSFC